MGCANEVDEQVEIAKDLYRQGITNNEKEALP